MVSLALQSADGVGCSTGFAAPKFHGLHRFFGPVRPTQGGLPLAVPSAINADPGSPQLTHPNGPRVLGMRDFAARVSYPSQHGMGF